jgi:hypothetical protein
MDTAAIEAVAAVEKTVDSAREAVAAPAGNSLDTSNLINFLHCEKYRCCRRLQLLNPLSGTGKEGRVTKNDI